MWTGSSGCAALTFSTPVDRDRVVLLAEVEHAPGSFGCSLARSRHAAAVVADARGEAPSSGSPRPRRPCRPSSSRRRRPCPPRRDAPWPRPRRPAAPASSETVSRSSRPRAMSSACVAELDAALDPVEQRRRDREIAVGRIAVADRPDVAVDPEDLLHDDQPAARPPRGLGAIDAEPVAVGRRAPAWSFPCRSLPVEPSPRLPRCAGRRSTASPSAERPERDLREEQHEAQADQLQHDERQHAREDRVQGDVGRGHALEVEGRRAEGRGQIGAPACSCRTARRTRSGRSRGSVATGTKIGMVEQADADPVDEQPSTSRIAIITRMMPIGASGRPAIRLRR